MNTGAYIYVFGSLNIQGDQVLFFKIGVTQNRDFNTRISSLQTGCPNKINLVSAVYINAVKTAYVLERHFHWRFKECRSNGEWFCSSPSIIKFAENDIFEYGEYAAGERKDQKLPEHEQIEDKASFFARLMKQVSNG